MKSILAKLFDGRRRPILPEPEPAPPLDENEDPYDQPVQLEIRDVIDLHTIPPKQVKAVVEEYMKEALAHGFRYVRIIHGKGMGVQREMVRTVLGRTSFVSNYHDAPPEAGGLGATIAELDLGKPAIAELDLGKPD
jgi:dsDNA-specific endonuclease/ATPase MutS2